LNVPLFAKANGGTFFISSSVLWGAHAARVQFGRLAQTFFSESPKKAREPRAPLFFGVGSATFFDAQFQG
jgi:hypothetical protein